MPTGAKSIGLFIKNREFEAARFELHVINNQSAAFHVQDLHARAVSVNKNENIAVLHIAPHLVGHHTAEGVETATHVGGMGIQVVVHRRGQAVDIPEATTRESGVYHPG